MGDTIRVTALQAQVLMNGALQNKMLKEVGGRTFNDQAQAKINEKFRLLAKALKKVSTKKEGKYYSGPFSNWIAIEMRQSTMNAGGDISLEMAEVQKVTEYKLKDQDLEIEIEGITGAVKSGIYWLCYLWAHPGSQFCQAAGTQDEVVWPLIEQIGKVGELRKDIGLVTDGDEEYFGEPAPAAEEKKTELKAV